MTEKDKIAYRAWGALEGIADLADILPADKIAAQIKTAAAEYKRLAEEAEKK